MPEKSTIATVEKPNLHPRNKHRGRYNFDFLIQASPALASFIKLNDYQDVSIDFADPAAVRALNQALLKAYYSVNNWDIPPNYLCPPIPGRADYVHYLADLLASTDKNPESKPIRVLDIGVGANVIYPLIGSCEYGWQFVGADIDATALANAQRIIDSNHLSSTIELRLQAASTHIFNGIIKPNEYFDLTLCNPPFHSSIEEANAGTSRKWQNLGPTTNKRKTLNFGGQHAELFCKGGEEAFINNMILESAQIQAQCHWFTTLVSKSATLPSIYRTLKRVNASKVKTVDMAQGQKKSRFVAWSFLNTAHLNTVYLNTAQKRS